jgi:GNAT superfamily N-acetyltransferase
MSRLLIRPFREADRPVLREIFLAARRMAFHWIAPAKFQLADFDDSTLGERIWVAELEGLAVAFASVWEPGNFLHSLFVDPAHHGRGIGSALLAACLPEMGRPARLKCKKQNTPAMDFYRRRGWTIESEGIGEEGEFYLLRYDRT